MTLFKSKKGEVQNIIRKVANALNTREKQWNEWCVTSGGSNHGE